MTAKILRDRLRANIAGALADARVAGQLTHAPSKGALREIAVRSLLRPLLRPGMDVTSGFVVDATGEISTQLDVIIYASSVVPPVFVSEGISCIPAEACLQVIEVKSKLTRAELVSSVEAAYRLSMLALQQPQGRSGVRDHVLDLGAYAGGSNWPYVPSPVKTQVPTVFSILAFDSDLRSSEWDRFLDVKKEAVPPEQQCRNVLHDICVVGRGYWRMGLHEPFHVPSSESYDEIIEQLAVAADTWADWLEYRGNVRLRPYLSDH